MSSRKHSVMPAIEQMTAALDELDYTAHLNQSDYSGHPANADIAAGNYDQAAKRINVIIRAYTIASIDLNNGVKLAIEFAKEGGKPDQAKLGKADSLHLNFGFEMAMGNRLMNQIGESVSPELLCQFNKRCRKANKARREFRANFQTLVALKNTGKQYPRKNLPRKVKGIY